MARLPSQLVSRLLLGRAVRWTAVSALALALLALLVDWVELGARGGAPVVQALTEAALRLPAHLGQAAPLVAALGAALALVGLRRSGEWQALEGAGVGPWGRLGPFLALGWAVGLAGAAVDGWITPWAGRTRTDLAALHQRGPMRAGGATWLALGDTLFELRGEPAGGHLDGARAFALPGGRLHGAWAADSLGWDGARWAQDGAPGSTGEAPWDALPAPAALAELVGTTPLPERTWVALAADGSPAANAERDARWSRSLGCGPAAMAGAAVPALMGPGALPVLLAALPVLAWEGLATVAQAQAAAGAVPPWTPAAVRLLLAILVLGLMVRRMRRS